jgi:hypothetical protein
VLSRKLRYDPKGFSQCKPDGDGGWIENVDGVRRVPYRLPELIEAVANERPMFIAEGEKAVEALVGLGVPATCAGGALKWRDDYSQFLKGANVIILPDNDEAGRKARDQIARSLTGVAGSIKVLPLPGLPESGDAYDWIEAGGTANKLWELVAEVEKGEQQNEPRLHPLCIHELFELNIPERQMMLDPIIPEKGLIMLYATRGVGKTHLAVGVSLAVAAGTNYLKWTAVRPRKVLHIDGEMPASELRQRFKQCMEGMNVKPEPGMLQVLSSDLIDTGIGNFASAKMQAELEPLLKGVGLLVLDNLSSLTTVIRDNDAESWNPIQEWLLRLRRRVSRF